tara:strand:+ start:320 stop:520 length:201 start_codon:yes stop_codon:yes gene_type:complete
VEDRNGEPVPNVIALSDHIHFARTSMSRKKWFAAERMIETAPCFTLPNFTFDPSISLSEAESPLYA